MGRNPKFLIPGLLLLWWSFAFTVRADNWQTLDTDAVRLHYETMRQLTAERLATISPSLFRELEAATGLAFDLHPTVIPVSQRNKFRHLGGRDGMVAFALPASNQVVLDLSHFDSQPEELRPVLKHEYVHLLLHHHITARHLPRWLDEGIAQQLSDGISEYLPGRRQMILGEALAADRVLPLAALSARFPRDTFGRQLAYEQSRSIVSYMVGRFGDDFIPALLGRMADGAEADAAFQSISGIPLATFEADWQAQQMTPFSRIGRMAGHATGVLFFLAALATLVGYARYRRRREAYALQEEDDDSGAG